MDIHIFKNEREIRRQKEVEKLQKRKGITK